MTTAPANRRRGRVGGLRLAAVLLVLAPISARSDAVGAGAPDEPRIWRVGVLTDNPPFSYIEDGRPPQGFAVELLERIERTMGLRLERVVGPTAEINRAFEEGRLDMVQSYVPNRERQAYARFSRPYLEMAGAIFVRRGASGITRLGDLAGRRVMVHPRSVGERVLLDAGLQDSIVHVGSIEEALRRLDAGEHDATLVSRLTGLATVERLGLRQVMATGGPVPGYSVNYCFAVRREHAALAAQINEGLAILEPRGEIREIYDHLFAHIEPRRYSALDIAVAVSGGLTLALLVALFAIARQRRLHREIARQAAELRVREESYRTVFESTRDGLVVFETPTHPPAAWRPVQANPAARRILGLPADGAPDIPPTHEALRTHLAAALDAADLPPVDLQLAHDGAPRWVHVSISRLGADGRLVVLRDITEARLAAERVQRTEAQARQNQKLEAIGTLASGVAHDFNNILTAIVGNAELMRLDLAGEHPAAPALEEIRLAADRARALVRQILTFSRRSETRPEVLDAGPIIKETLRFLSAAASSAVEFRHRIEAACPRVEIDPTQLHQVLMNLGTNAVRALGDRPGLIEFSQGAAQVSTGAAEHPADLAPGAYLTITVRDTGEGMTPEVLQHVFEPFFTTRPPGEGTGLGLAVVHGIIRGCGGAIDVASTRGAGTTVRLYLPAATREPGDAAATAATTPRGRGETVLLVDDEPAILKAAGRLLQHLGYRVIAHTGPGDALAALRAAPREFSVVLTDLTMPGMSGLELADRIRAVAPAVPVILISGFINDRATARARAAGIDQVLEKPLALDEIGRAVADALARRA